MPPTRKPTKCKRCGGPMNWPQRVIDAQIPSLDICPACFAQQPDDSGDRVDGDDMGRSMRDGQ